MAWCPVTELGYLRISTQPAFGATFPQAKRMLRDWKEAEKPESIPCDLDALDIDDPSTGKHTTGFYLASLAQTHGMQLATLDGGIKHQTAFVIPGWNTFPDSRLPDSRRSPRSMTWWMAPGYSIRIVRGMSATSRANNERNQPPG